MKPGIRSAGPLAYYLFMQFGDSRIYHSQISFETQKHLYKENIRIGNDILLQLI